MKNKNKSPRNHEQSGFNAEEEIEFIDLESLEQEEDEAEDEEGEIDVSLDEEYPMDRSYSNYDGVPRPYYAESCPQDIHEYGNCYDEHEPGPKKNGKIKP